MEFLLPCGVRHNYSIFAAAIHELILSVLFNNKGVNLKIVLIGLVVILINIPFGYWRASLRKFSAKWFLSVHLPIPFVYAIRVYEGLGWDITTFPVLAGAFFAGQFIGSWLRTFKKIIPPVNSQEII